MSNVRFDSSIVANDSKQNSVLGAPKGSVSTQMSNIYAPRPVRPKGNL